MSAPPPMPVLSVLIPVLDEAAAIPALAADLDQALTTSGLTWEAVWIDDGSRDETPAILSRLPPPHRALRLPARSGQAAAIMAGAHGARGEWLGILDGDGQNDPADLPRQLTLARERHFDLVGGVRTPRRDHVIRRISSRIANLVRRCWLRDGASDAGCATKILRRQHLITLPFFHGMQCYLPALMRARGLTTTEIPVNHRPRIGGRAKYGIGNRLGSGLRDLIGVRWLIARQRRWEPASEQILEIPGLSADQGASQVTVSTRS